MNDEMELKDVWGREIILTDERLKHIWQHPEIVAVENTHKPVITTITEPDTITRSYTDESILLFYRYFEETIVGNKYFCIVVKYTENRNFIVTAYFTDRIKKGEILWTK